MVLIGLSLYLLLDAWQGDRRAEEIIRVGREANSFLTALKDLTLERARTNVVLCSEAPISPSDKTFIEELRKSVDRNIRKGVDWLTQDDPLLAGRLQEEYGNLVLLRERIDGVIGEETTTSRSRLQGEWFEQSTDFIHRIIESLDIVGKRQDVPGLFAVYQQLLVDTLVFRDRIGQSDSIMTAAISKKSPWIQLEYRRFIENLAQADFVWSKMEADSFILGNEEFHRQKSTVFHAYYEMYRPVLEETVRPALAGTVPPQKAQQLKELSVPAFDSVYLLLEQYGKAVAADMQFRKRNASASLARAMIQFIAGLAVVLYTILYFRNRLFQPLGNIIQALKTIRKGEPVPDLEGETERTDEVGQLAAGVKMLETSMAEERHLRKLTEFLATSDQLTGLHNRHFLEQNIASVMDHSDRYNEPVSLIMFDLDHFKQVNDTKGHPAGDAVLKQSARLAENLIRSSDLLIRFGGEEFLLLMPHASISGAVAAAEKIRESFENIDHPGVGRVTASFGVSEKEKNESFHHWYKRTDDALYIAKQSGRNRVASATEATPPRVH
jgi:diguanylate cyclase (GGDEF)-like protein